MSQCQKVGRGTCQPDRLSHLPCSNDLFKDEPIWPPFMKFALDMRLSFGHNPVLIRWPTGFCVTILANVVVLIRIRHYATATRRVSIRRELKICRPFGKVFSKGNLPKLTLQYYFTGLITGFIWLSLCHWPEPWPSFDFLPMREPVIWSLQKLCHLGQGRLKTYHQHIPNSPALNTWTSLRPYIIRVKAYEVRSKTSWPGWHWARRENLTYTWSPTSYATPCLNVKVR